MRLEHGLQMFVLHAYWTDSNLIIRHFSSTSFGKATNGYRSGIFDFLRPLSLPPVPIVDT